MPYKDIEKRRAYGRAAAKRYHARHPERARAAVKKWAKRNPDKEQERAIRRNNRDPNWGRRYWYFTTYGITLEQRDAMIAAQGGKCCICCVGKAEHVDHNHVTKKVRGMLCGSCNRAIGLFGENVERLIAAAAYLRKFA